MSSPERWSFCLGLSMLIWLVNPDDPLFNHILSAAYVRQRTGSALIQAKACRLFGAKPLPETLLTYCQSDSKEQTSVKLKYKNFHYENAFEKSRLRNVGHFVSASMC